jgi:hypothetical protein
MLTLLELLLRLRLEAQFHCAPFDGDHIRLDNGDGDIHADCTACSPRQRRKAGAHSWSNWWHCQGLTCRILSNKPILRLPNIFYNMKTDKIFGRFQLNQKSLPLLQKYLIKNALNMSGE